MDLPQIDDYRSLVLDDTPLLDVRAPVEFDQGAFPFAKNHPLINNNEREKIGICYKTLGQDKAIELGHKLVQGEIKSERIEQWQAFIKDNPKGVLYCFRGGMRSKISQQWIFEQTGIAYPRIKGGYKALRLYLLDELAISTETIQPIMLGGRTGIGKTLLLQKLNQQIDLEGIFHHRGSVFGNHVTPQPSQIDIENLLSIALLKCRNKHYSHLVLEDEGNYIGSRDIPNTLSNRMKQSSIIILEASIEERINITLQEYITEALAEHQTYSNEETGFISWSQHLQGAMDKIQRRLGGVRYRALKTLLTNAIEHQQLTGEHQLHEEWIKILLVDYYDPMYDYQITKKNDRIVFTGSQKEVLDFLKERYQVN